MTALTCYRTDRSGLVIFLNLPAADSNDNEGRTGISTFIRYGTEHMRHNCWAMMSQCHLVGAISNFESVCVVLLALTFFYFNYFFCRQAC